VYLYIFFRSLVCQHCKLWYHYMSELTCNKHFWQLKEFTLMWIKKVTMYEKGEVVCYWQLWSFTVLWQNYSTFVLQTDYNFWKWSVLLTEVFTVICQLPGCCAYMRYLRLIWNFFQTRFLCGLLRMHWAYTTTSTLIIMLSFILCYW